jgi:hypothetical protein
VIPSALALAGLLAAAGARADVTAGAAVAPGAAILAGVAADSLANAARAGEAAGPPRPSTAAAAPTTDIAPRMISALALPAPDLELLGLGSRRGRSITSRDRGGAGMRVLSAERARILLRSLTLPGWGQATVGHHRAAGVFLIAETGVWASFTAFRIQQQMRRDSYERTARLVAGIDLRGRDEEFHRIVGSFLSSDEYNHFVVFRDAANLFYDDPVKYREYIAKHELHGKDAWTWPSVESLLRYRGQRKKSQRAAQRANTTLAIAVANRLVSAVHATRVAGQTPHPHAWNLEIAPAPGDDATAFRAGVRARF